jgi:hypothetical protein
VRRLPLFWWTTPSFFNKKIKILLVKLVGRLPMFFWELEERLPPTTSRPKRELSTKIWESFFQAPKNIIIFYSSSFSLPLTFIVFPHSWEIQLKLPPKTCVLQSLLRPRLTYSMTTLAIVLLHYSVIYGKIHQWDNQGAGHDSMRHSLLDAHTLRDFSAKPI